MLEALHLERGHHVLEVGTGTGYNAALLRHLVGERGRVTTIELDAGFARRARRALAAVGASARVVVGDGRDGVSSGARYDRIVVTASAGELFRAWLDQLKDGGLIEAPLRLGSAASYQVVATFERQGEQLISIASMAGSFMPLRGPDPNGSNGAVSPTLSAFVPDDGLSSLCSLDGHLIDRLSPSARRRSLSTLLGGGHLVDRLPAEAAGGLTMFLALRGRGRIVYCTIGRRFGVAVLASSGGSIATVTRDAGGDGRVEVFGDERALALFRSYRSEWERHGSPRPNDLRLVVGFGDAPMPRTGRQVRLGGCTVSIDWRRPRSTPTG